MRPDKRMIFIVPFAIIILVICGIVLFRIVGEFSNKYYAAVEITETDGQVHTDYFRRKDKVELSLAVLNVTKVQPAEKSKTGFDSLTIKSNADITFNDEVVHECTLAPNQECLISYKGQTAKIKMLRVEE